MLNLIVLSPPVILMDPSLFFLLILIILVFVYVCLLCVCVCVCVCVTKGFVVMGTLFCQKSR